jgi:hypothetical protein
VYLGPVVVRAAELTSAMLGQAVTVTRARRADVAVNPWLSRGVLVEVVHRLVEDTVSGRTACAVVLTLAVGESHAEITFVVGRDDLITLY